VASEEKNVTRSINPFVEKFCEDTISTNGLTVRASARVRGEYHPDPERDSNFFWSYQSKRRKCNDNMALLNKRQRVSLETFSEEFEERYDWGPERSNHERSRHTG
jgi:hypothetical protein